MLNVNYVTIVIIEGYGLLFGHSCRLFLLFGEIVTWQIQPMGDLLKYDAFYNTTKYYDYNKACLKLENEEIIVRYCIPPGPIFRGKRTFKAIFAGSLCLISVIFFFITIFVYAYLPFLRNLHGKVLMCHVFSLGMGLFTSANIKLNPLVDPKMTYFSYYLRKTIGKI